METVRESWTDERMDGLKDQVVELSRRMDTRFESMEARIDSSQRMVVQLIGIMFATIVGLISAQTALLLAFL